MLCMRQARVKREIRRSPDEAEYYRGRLTLAKEESFGQTMLSISSFGNHFSNSSFVVTLRSAPVAKYAWHLS